MTETGANILIVDDDLSVLHFLSRLLTKEGYSVTTSACGESALAHIENQTFDLVLVDLRMPDMDGLEVLAELRQRSPDTAAIILTAHGSIETAAEAVRQGASDYLLKPCKAEDLRASVHSALEKCRQRRQQREQARHFLYETTHELRTLLTGLHLNLDLLQRWPEQGAQYLENLRRELARMDTMVQNTLTLARLEENGLALPTFTMEDFNDVVAQVLEICRLQAEAGGLTLSWDLDASLPLVRGVREQLKQVVMNLVTNAIKYTPAGRIHVRTSFDPHLEQVCLEVEDTGVGISEEDIAHLFERFYRGKVATHSEIPGSGLGLAIVMKIVMLHGGDIAVESQEGLGSTFRIWLPPAIQSETYAACAAMGYDKVASEISDLSGSCNYNSRKVGI
jgi:signal transduction histidine kinase